MVATASSISCIHLPIPSLITDGSALQAKAASAKQRRSFLDAVRTLVDATASSRQDKDDGWGDGCRALATLLDKVLPCDTLGLSRTTDAATEASARSSARPLKFTLCIEEGSQVGGTIKVVPKDGIKQAAGAQLVFKKTTPMTVERSEAGSVVVHFSEECFFGKKSPFALNITSIEVSGTHFIVPAFGKPRKKSHAKVCHLAAGCWLLAAGCWLLAVYMHGLLSALHCPLSAELNKCSGAGRCCNRWR